MILTPTKISNAYLIDKNSKQAYTSIANHYFTICNNINLNELPNSYYNKAEINFGASFNKTLSKITPSANELKYFFKGEDNILYPILAKYIPQRHFGVQKYLGEETRYMATACCGPCSKFVIYDPINKIGLLAHIDNPSIVNSSDKIRNKLMKEGISNFENLIVRHVSGVSETPEYNVKAVHTLMEKLGLKPEQLIEENFDTTVNKMGIILDLSNGQTYQLDTPYNLFDNFDRISTWKKIARDYRQKLNSEEYLKFMKEALMAHNRYNIYMIKNPAFIEVD